MDDLFGSPQGASDPTSDFLERERQALGTDATSFQSSASADYDFEGGASAFPDLEGETSVGLGGLGSPAAGGGGSDEYGFDSMGGGQETRSVQVSPIRLSKGIGRSGGEGRAGDGTDGMA